MPKNAEIFLFLKQKWTCVDRDGHVLGIANVNVCKRILLLSYSLFSFS